MSKRDAKGDLLQRFEKSILSAIEFLRDKLRTESQVPRKPKLLLAFSGGCDSTLLVTLCHRLSKKIPLDLCALYVHHGLSKNADQWGEFCKAICGQFDIPFSMRRVRVDKTKGGVEAGARQARYDAIFALGKEIEADAVLTAHHRDDQLETFLIQWIRGTGIEGLIGMPRVKTTEPIPVVRPFLDFTRAQIEEAAKALQLQWIEDESNEDTAYLRNAIRHKILPELDKIRPGWKSAAARSIDNLAEDARIIEEAVREELQAVSQAGAIDQEKFNTLSLSLRHQVLRAFLQEKGFSTLQKSRLNELIRQIEFSSQVSSLIYSEGIKELRLCKGKLFTRIKPEETEAQEVELSWRGEKELNIPEFKGTLIFTTAKKGIPATELQKGPLILSKRKGGECLKLTERRPSKPLKQLFQQAQIPDFERERLPLLWLGGKLIFVAGLGMDVRSLSTSEGQECYRLMWMFD